MLQLELRTFDTYTSSLSLDYIPSPWPFGMRVFLCTPGPQEPPALRVYSHAWWLRASPTETDRWSRERKLADACPRLSHSHGRWVSDNVWKLLLLNTHQWARLIKTGISQGKKKQDSAKITHIASCNRYFSCVCHLFWLEDDLLCYICSKNSACSAIVKT